MPNNIITIGNKLRVARASKGLSQDYVASKLGLSQQQYRRFENEDQNQITWGRLEQIAKILETDLDVILSIDKIPIFNSNIKDCHQVGNLSATYQNIDFEKERLSYQKHIDDLKDEVTFYRQLVEKAILKKQDDNSPELQ